MVVRYDSLNRFETPNLTLCNPGSVFNSAGGIGQTSGTLSRVVCPLVNTSDIEIIFNFNSTSELHFRINLIHDEDPDINLAFRKSYRSVANRRMVFVEDIGYFIITSVDTGFDGIQDYKDVTAVSLESEIQSKTVPYIADGTYKFTSADDKGIIDKVMVQLPLWEIDHIDTSVAERYRTFSDVDTSTNCLGFMLDSIQDAYECIFTFDIKTRTINVYDKNNYTKETNIHITKEDVIKSLKINENADDLYTAITVLGQSDETISSVNPLGGNTIYKFDYYLGWMTPALSSKVSTWQNTVKSFEAEYYNLNLEYYSKKNTSANIQMDISNLKTQITIYTRARENIEATGGTGNVEAYNEAIRMAGGQDIDISGEISEIKARIVQQINSCNNSISEKTTQLNSINARLNQLQNGWNEGTVHHKGFAEIINTVGITHYFTEAEIDELQSYIFEAEYRDEYVVFTNEMNYNDKFSQMNQLYVRAKERLANVSVPSQQFSVDVENFLFAKEFEKWSTQLETGCVINVELEQYGTIIKDGQSIDGYYSDIASLFMTSVTINYEDMNMSMTFGNRLKRFDTKALFDTVLGNISKTANSLTYVKDLVAPIKHGELNSIEETINNSRNITMGAALSATNQSVVIDESGYSGRTMLQDGTFAPEQIKITGENIVFTTDNWDSSATAIGKIILPDGTSVYGVNANVLIGSLIMGDNLVIYDDEGQPLLSVLDNIVTTMAKKSDLSALQTQITQNADAIELRATKSSVIELSSTVATTKTTAESAKTDAAAAVASSTTAITAANSSIATDVLHYLATSASTGVTTSTSGWTTTPQSVTATNKYLWTYHTYTTVGGTSSNSTPVITGVYGDKGQQGAPGADGKDGTSGNGIKSINYYYATTSTQTAPSAGSVTSLTIPTLSSVNKYLWQKEVIEYTVGTTPTTTVALIGVYGDAGQKGADGTNGTNGKDGTSVTISSTSSTYVASNSQTVTPTTGWSSTIPTLSAATPYLWTKTVVNYSPSGSTTTYSVSSTLQGVEVGGRNYALNTATEYVGTASDDHGGVTWSWMQNAGGYFDNTRLEYRIEKNTQYILSFEYEMTNATEDLNIGCGIGSRVPSHNYYDRDLWAPQASYATYGGSLTRGKFVYVLAPKNFSDPELFFAFRPIRYDHTPAQPVTIRIWNFKLEKGNKATDWTPAPEDVNSAVSAAQTTANTASTNASTAISTANSANTNASTALSTANTAKSTADTAQSTANTAKSTADTAKTTATNAQTTANSANTKVDGVLGSSIGSVTETSYTEPRDTGDLALIHKLEGKSRKGYQLLDVKKLANAYCSVAEDGMTITVNNTTSSNIYPQFPLSLPAGQYTLSTDTTSQNVQAYVYNGSYNLVVHQARKTNTFTVGEGEVTRFQLAVFTGATDTFKVQLEEGSIAHDFEPYTEEIIHAPVDKVMDVGRNLLPYTDIPERTAEGGLSVDMIGGEVHVKGTCSKDSVVYLLGYYGAKTPLFSLPKGVYHLTNVCLETSGRAARYTGAFTLTEDTEICAVALSSSQSAYNAVFTGGTTYNLSYCPMLERGSVAHDFVPYHTSDHPVPASIQNLPGYGWGITDTIRNYVDWDNRKYVQMVGVIRLDGSQTFITGNPTVRHYIMIGAGAKPNGLSLCREFEPSSVALSSAPFEKIWLQDVSGDIRLNIYTERFTASTLRSYFLEHPMDLYYELATPIETSLDSVLTDVEKQFFTSGIPYETGGSLTYHHRYGDNGYPVGAPRLVEYRNAGSIDNSNSLIYNAGALAENAQSKADSAQSTADSAMAGVDGINAQIANNQIGAQVFYQSTSPTVSKNGDVWINTTDNSMFYRRDGVWVSAKDMSISKLLADVTALQDETGTLSQLLVDTQTAINQNVNNVEISVTSQIRGVAGDLEAFKKTQGTYLNVADDGVRIGDVTNANSYTFIDSDEFSIIANGSKSASFNGSQTTMQDVTATGTVLMGAGDTQVSVANGEVSAKRMAVANSMTIGNWSIDTSNGLAIKWIGG